jgi:MSHA biogenesis protein MshN
MLHGAGRGCGRGSAEPTDRDLVSVINKMLRELDQRHAMSAPMDSAASKDIRPVPAKGRRREWLWGSVVLLVLIAFGWMGWVFYQLEPQQIATDSATVAAARRVPSVPLPTPPAALPVALVPEQKPLEQQKEEKLTAEPLAENLKLAQTIDTPIVERPLPEKAAPAAKNSANSRKAPAPSAANARVEKRDIAPPPAQRAEAEFRRGMALLQQGRVSEAEEHFTNAITQQPAHESARQTLGALLIEQRRLDEARKVLQDGLALNRGQAQFATALGRILVERGDYPAALEVLKASRAAGKTSADFDTLLGSVLGRMGRHREASEAYQDAVRAAPNNGAAWMGLAISLESLDRRVDAADAYRRALASGTLNDDLKSYAEQKSRQLR